MAGTTAGHCVLNAVCVLHVLPCSAVSKAGQGSTAATQPQVRSHSARPWVLLCVHRIACLQPLTALDGSQAHFCNAWAHMAAPCCVCWPRLWCVLAGEVPAAASVLPVLWCPAVLSGGLCLCCAVDLLRSYWCSIAQHWPRVWGRCWVSVSSSTQWHSSCSLSSACTGRYRSIRGPQMQGLSDIPLDSNMPDPCWPCVPCKTTRSPFRSMHNACMSFC